MDHGTPDLFGYVPSSKPPKSKKNKTAVITPAADRYFVVYAPGRQPFYLLSTCIFAFVLWYVFGAQLTDIMPFNIKELPAPIYGALTFLGLVAGCIWLCVDFCAATIAYFRPNTERRIYGRYRRKWKSWWLRTFFSVGTVMVVLLASVLVLHGYWNARSVAIVISNKLVQPPRLAEEQVAELPVLPVPPAAVAKLEPFGPPAPVGMSLTSPIATGSILVTPAKKRTKPPAVTEVDPLSKSIKEICDWFERTFGSSTK